MFVALKSRDHVHIDQISLSGQGEHVHAFEEELGDDDIKMIADYNTNTLFWTDSDFGRISYSDYRQLRAGTFRSKLKKPYSIAMVNGDIFWTNLRSASIYWTHNSVLSSTKTVTVETPMGAAFSVPTHIPLLASSLPMIADHPCQHFNGGCSHVCVTMSKYTAACLCPAGLVFQDSNNRTCIDALDCEFRCRSGECLTMSRKCNQRKDCPDGSDEEDCDAKKGKHTQIVCSIGEFMCHNAEQCIDKDKRCDGRKNCRDGSDEKHCDKFGNAIKFLIFYLVTKQKFNFLDKSKQCHKHQHACDNGHCIDYSAMCDGINDCGDNSDEKNCKSSATKLGSISHPVCDKNMFQCNSGTCIAKSWECDGKIDCTDSSDEHDKCGM